MRYDHQWLKKQHYSHQESRYLLDPIGKYGEANQHTRAAVQVPHRGIMLEHLRAQKNGEAHHASHEGVKPWKRRKETDDNAKQTFLTTKKTIQRPGMPPHSRTCAARNMAQKQSCR